MTGTDEIVLPLTAKGLTLGGAPLKSLTPQASLSPTRVIEDAAIAREMWRL
jgi:hypothetical protein